MNQACLKSLTLFIGWSTEVRREMTKAHEVECATLTRDIRALLAKDRFRRGWPKSLINTLVAMIKHLGKKDTMEEAAEDLVLTLQRAISKSH